MYFLKVTITVGQKYTDDKTGPLQVSKIVQFLIGIWQVWENIVLKNSIRPILIIVPDFHCQQVMA